MANRHPFPTSSVAATFGGKTGGSRSSVHSGTASYFMPDTHISGRESAGTYLSHSTWTAIGLPSASFTNLDHIPWNVDDTQEPIRRFIELVLAMVDLGAKPPTLLLGRFPRVDFVGQYKLGRQIHLGLDINKPKHNPCF